MTPHLPDPAASAAILIGTSGYRDTRLGALPSVVNNVSDLSGILTNRDFWGLPRERCRSVLDCGDPAETIGLLAEFANLASDTFVVYYSGHGVLTREGDLVLPTGSTNLDLSKYTTLPYAWVRDIMGRCRAARRIVILDCCFSGRALHAMSDPATAVIGQVDVDGIYVMTSAAATATSIAPEGARNTAFTGGLLGILHDGVPGLNELLSLDDLYDQTLMAMVRRGWPRPQRLGTNTVGRLGLLRNRAWRKIFAPAAIKPPVHPVPDRQLAEGIREAVTAIAATLGRPGEDGLEVLDRAFPGPAASEHARPPGPGSKAAGVIMVRETMLAMREQYGDGATTAALILGALVDGLQDLLKSGASPAQLATELSASTAELACRLDPGSAGDSAGQSSPDQLSAAIRAALGAHEKAEAVVSAAVAVGAGNVETALGNTEAAEAPDSAFVLDTVVLAPNAASGPIALEDPLIVVSTDGEVNSRALAAEAAGLRSPVLIIAPRVSIFAVRGLLHSFPQVVVVRPANPGFDLAALRDRLGHGDLRPGWCRARRALVLASATTIDRPPRNLELARNRITLTISDPGHFAVAVRALAVARSVADAGVVPGGGAALYAAAQAFDAGSPRPAEADGIPGHAVDTLVRAAACEPYKRLKLQAGPAHRQAEHGAVDSLATVRGALMHAAATAGRYLTAA